MMLLWNNKTPLLGPDNLGGGDQMVRPLEEFVPPFQFTYQ